MSQENVERLVKGYEAWNRDDMDTMLTLLDPDFEYVSTGVFPGLEPVYRGPDGFLAFWRDFRQVWESLQIEVEEVRDLGEQVVARLGFEGRGRADSKCDASSRTYGPSETASRCASRRTQTGPRPSKPWGCGSSCCAFIPPRSAIRPPAASRRPGR